MRQFNIYKKCPTNKKANKKINKKVNSKVDKKNHLEWSV